MILVVTMMGADAEASDFLRRGAPSSQIITQPRDRNPRDTGCHP